MNVKKLRIHSLGYYGFGKFLINYLKNAGIDTRCVHCVDYLISMVAVTKNGRRLNLTGVQPMGDPACALAPSYQEHPMTANGKQALEAKFTSQV
jgi:sugar/nucleoside kinase (ribokinase family)